MRKIVKMECKKVREGKVIWQIYTEQTSLSSFGNFIITPPKIELQMMVLPVKPSQRGQAKALRRGSHTRDGTPQWEPGRPTPPRTTRPEPVQETQQRSMDAKEAGKQVVAFTCHMALKP